MIHYIAHVSVLTRLLAEMSTEHLRELQRFAEVGRISASLIHDMSSPLTAAILHLEHGGGANELPSVRRARRSIQVLERYIETARQQLFKQGSDTIFEVEHEIRQIKHVLLPLAQQKNIYLRFNVRIGNCCLFGDPVKFQRIIVNLTTNAMEAYRDMPARKHPVRLVVSRNRKYLIIRVRDQGVGINTRQLPHLFDPFYTTKTSDSRNGLGIGLSIVRQYVENDFKGAVKVVSCPQAGTEMLVKLPLAPNDASC